MLGPFLERTRHLFDPIVVRLYVATVVGRLSQRFPYGTHRTILLPANTPTKLMENTSRDRAMLGYVTQANPAALTVARLSPSADDGVVNFGLIIGSNGPAGEFPATQTFVMRPGEQLFATPPVPGHVLVSTEFY